MSRHGSVLALGVALLLAGCFRTRYINLAPHRGAASDRSLRHGCDAPDAETPFGLAALLHLGMGVPGERVIPAAEICGGSEWVKEIRTERRFVQGDCGARPASPAVPGPRAEHRSGSSP